MRSQIAALVAVVSFSIAGQAHEQDSEARLDAYMSASARHDGFSGAVLVARKGQPILSKGYGMANYELDVPNTPKTVFRIGSITKSFTAVAILKLQERGVLNVSDSICK